LIWLNLACKLNTSSLWHHAWKGSTTACFQFSDPGSKFWITNCKGCFSCFFETQFCCRCYALVALFASGKVVYTFVYIEAQRNDIELSIQMNSLGSYDVQTTIPSQITLGLLIRIWKIDPFFFFFSGRGVRLILFNFVLFLY
jgi:hypothetical protein